MANEGLGWDSRWPKKFFRSLGGDEPTSRVREKLQSNHGVPWILFGQIIATSHDLSPNGRVVGEPCLKWPYFREIQVGEIL